VTSRTNRRLLGYGAIAAVVLVAATIAVLAYRSLQVPYQAPAVSSPVPALGCAPAPCADLQGYTLWVTNIGVQGDLVTMQVTFRNSSDSTHAAPEDLVLIDSQRNQSRAVFDAPACTPWSRHEFNHGATYGPVVVCFRPGTAAPPLVLRWSPDFGLVCCQTDIKLS
jgi:hypothetical protein